jgi:hypothetical protein
VLNILGFCNSYNNLYSPNYVQILLAVFDVIFKGLVQGQEFSFHDEFKRFFETVVKVLFINLLARAFLVYFIF